ncbi:Hpt domain-containing protein [Hydrogenovibrio sp. JE_KL2]|uniref:Hpt domain-containing protein n=1 Tax=Hydrogenovibrio sp. JE_KL2 TaxID=2651188 RepID=UPI00128E4A4B|nr:Hpt domain-containing protein [Hydrogenovibrio sp. JE_KL2]
MSILDNSHLDMLKDVIGEDLKEILDVFLQTAPAELAAMQQAFSQQDEVGLRLHSHTLKGSAANVGATELSLQAKKVEDAAKANDLSSVSEDIQQLEESLPAVLQALQDYINKI